MNRNECFLIACSVVAALLSTRCPAEDARQTVAAPTQGVQVDGRLDDEIWKGAQLDGQVVVTLDDEHGNSVTHEDLGDARPTRPCPRTIT